MSFEKLLKGFERFHDEYFKDSDVYTNLAARGQSPETLVIACSDSRNDPAHLMRSEPGDMFVIRNVAAIVPPYQPDGNYHGTSAAIEFAVRQVGVKNIVVLGHALCGGINALANQGGAACDHEFITHWLTIGEGVRKKIEQDMKGATNDQKLRALEKAMVQTSLDNLVSFPWIRERVDAGSLTLHGWYFDMLGGKLLNYDFKTRAFTEIAS